MKTSRLFMCLLMVFAITLASCSTDGEDGMDGAPGAQGTAGQDGQDGQDGEDGNANVISSGWVEYDTAVWEEVSNSFGIDQRLYPVPAPEVTQEVADNGFVAMYTRFVITETDTYALPFTENITGADPVGQELSLLIAPELLNIRMINVSGTGDPGTFGGEGIAAYRYIIIPSDEGGRQLSSSESIKAYYKEIGLDLSDYNAVMDYFDLEE